MLELCMSFRVLHGIRTIVFRAPVNRSSVQWLALLQWAYEKVKLHHSLFQYEHQMIDGVDVIYTPDVRSSSCTHFGVKANASSWAATVTISALKGSLKGRLFRWVCDLGTSGDLAHSRRAVQRRLICFLGVFYILKQVPSYSSPLV